MRFIFVGAVALGVWAGAAHAETLAEQAQKCWNPPPFSADAEIDAEFDVLLTESGAVKDITVTSYKPRNDLGKQAVKSASKAIEMCSPYQGGNEGLNKFRMTINEDGAAINPFK
ncbi:hypothetical protein Q5698_08260 [Brucella intermedia]|uniref:hypothetical protein n=1 Tax=Brucella intermedia TaxID=94625 RepID=UPI00273455E7|nr:hypothetical protein [Brucella intermedia]WLF95663.1 hypothetical protein Q5698_08260 [Brucella intermedia]